MGRGCIWRSTSRVKGISFALGSLYRTGRPEIGVRWQHLFEACGARVPGVTRDELEKGVRSLRESECASFYRRAISGTIPSSAFTQFEVVMSVEMGRVRGRYHPITVSVSRGGVELGVWKDDAFGFGDSLSPAASRGLRHCLSGRRMRKSTSLSRR